MDWRPRPFSTPAGCSFRSPRNIALAADATRAKSRDRRVRLSTESDSRIPLTRCGCTAPCKEQAGKRGPPSAIVFYSHRLVLRSWKIVRPGDPRVSEGSAGIAMPSAAFITPIHLSNSPSRCRSADLRPGFASLLRPPPSRSGRSAEQRLRIFYRRRGM